MVSKTLDNLRTNIYKHIHDNNCSEKINKNNVKVYFRMLLYVVYGQQRVLKSHNFKLFLCKLPWVAGTSVVNEKF